MRHRCTVTNGCLFDKADRDALVREFREIQRTVESFGPVVWSSYARVHHRPGCRAIADSWKGIETIRHAGMGFDYLTRVWHSSEVAPVRYRACLICGGGSTANV